MGNGNRKKWIEKGIGSRKWIGNGESMGSVMERIQIESKKWIRVAGKWIANR